MKSKSTKVVIIGAGYSGIAAAKKLFENNIAFVILEARNRIGGRVKTQKLKELFPKLNSDHNIELGAQWIGPEHLEINKWINEVKFHTFDTFDDGYHIFRFKGKETRYKSGDNGPGLNNIYSKNLYPLVLDLITQFAKKVCSNPLQENSRARFLDRYSVQDFFNMIGFILPASDVHGMIKGHEASSAQDSKNVSILHALHEINASGSFQEIIKVRNGAQQTMITEGLEPLLSRIFSPFKNRIKCNTPVTGVHEMDESCLVRANGEEIYASKVIVAIPPILASRITFLGRDFQNDTTDLQRIVTPGTPIKCFAIYDTPFWRENGLSGQITSDDPRFILSYDCSPQNGNGVLLFFRKELKLGEFDSKDEKKKERESALVEEIVKSFGEKGRNIRGYHEHIWNEESEPWSVGGYAGAYPPGAWTKFGAALQKPTNRVHWAGTETADKFYGYMEGAILSGYRAADEVINSLNMNL